MLDEHHGTEGIDFECFERGFVVYLRGRFFGVEDTGGAEGEVEVVG